MIGQFLEWVMHSLLMTPVSGLGVPADPGVHRAGRGTFWLQMLKKLQTAVGADPSWYGLILRVVDFFVIGV